MNALEYIMPSSPDAEQISYVPRGETESKRVELTALVVRGGTERLSDQSAIGHGDEETRVIHRCTVRVFSTVHTDFGGVENPKVGDKWKLPIVDTGEPVDGWKAGAAQPGRGQWVIPLQYSESIERGGKRRMGTT